MRKPRAYKLSLNLPKITPGGGLAVTARATAVTGRLRATTFDLGKGEHLLLTGPNGAGKTTLVTWIAHGQPPSDAAKKAGGTIAVSGRVAYVPQSFPRAGDPYFTEKHWTNGIGEIGAGILHPSLWAIPIEQLSDDNQRRAQIALATAQNPEVLVIDEPTNYLDLAAIEQLEAALYRWKGTVIITSHDRWLIQHWQGQRLELQPASLPSESQEIP